MIFNIFSKSFYYFLVAFLAYGILYADEFSSSGYKVLDPVINSAEYSSSNTFKLWGNVSQIGNGLGSSSSFSNNAGFLTYPFASVPVVFASPSNSQVSLSWSSSVGFLGWTISSYKIGYSSNSSGPYSYINVGNTTSSSVTGLTNNLNYYFVVVALDIFGNDVATSTEISSTPVSSSGGSGSSGGGGGGGGGFIPTSQTSVTLSGRAYPGSKIFVLKDGQIAVTTVSDPGANFSVTLTDLSASNFNFSVYSEDNQKRRSEILTFPVTLTSGSNVTISNIFISPTIAVDKIEVKKGEDIMIFGQTIPSAEVTIQVNSEQEFFVKTPSDKNGAYFYMFDTSVLEIGGHSTKSKAILASTISPFSKLANFKVGSKTTLLQSQKCPTRGDLNSDCKVNLVDFSIAAFWYKKTISPSFKEIEKNQLNSDGKIDLVDFSIMAYNWTG